MLTKGTSCAIMFSAHSVLRILGGVLLQEKQTELIRDEMCEKIIDAAEKLATSHGAHTVTVRKILESLGITNRVFYNRFRNIDEVLELVYRRTVIKIREIISSDIDENRDFFEQVMDLVVSSLITSYDAKMQFNQYVFQNDSLSRGNYEWWTAEIKKLIVYAMNKKLIKEVDPDVLSYSIWCFCRGYNADAVGRGLPKEEALKNFKYSFAFLLEGLKA